MNPSGQVNRYDEARRNRSIQRLLKAREALQLEEMGLRGRSDVLEEHAAVTVALGDISAILDRLTVAKPWKRK